MWTIFVNLVTHPLVLALVVVGITVAGSGYIIYLMVGKNGPVQQLSNNHLSGLPEMALSLVEIKNTLREANQMQIQLLSIISRIEGKLDR